MKTINLTQGKVALVDDKDFEWLNQYKWHISRVTSTGYAVRKSTYSDGKPRNLFLHRLLMDLQTGDTRQVDHINRNSLDNRKENLRICTMAQNMQNRNKTVSNKSGYKGVSWLSDKRSKSKWMAIIYYDGAQHCLGAHATKEKAALAYNQAALKHHGEFAYQNILEGTDEE